MTTPSSAAGLDRWAALGFFAAVMLAEILCAALAGSVPGGFPVPPTAANVLLGVTVALLTTLLWLLWQRSRRPPAAEGALDWNQVMDRVPIGYLITDAAGRILHWNAEAADLVELAEQSRGLALAKVLGPQRFGNHARARRDQTAGLVGVKLGRSVHYYARRSQGSVPVELLIQPLGGEAADGRLSVQLRRLGEEQEEGEVPLHLVPLQDVTRRVLASAILEETLTPTIELMLRSLGEHFEVSHACLSCENGPLSSLDEYTEWRRPGAGACRGGLQCVLDAEDGWLRRELMEGRSVRCGNTQFSELPPGVLAAARAASVGAFVVLPLQIYGEYAGCVALLETDGSQPWERRALDVVTDLVRAFSRAVERQQAARQCNLYAVELREALDAAESSSKAKSEFLANMSHEIRTPMTAIVGFSHLLVRPGVSPEQYREWAEQVRRNSDYLLSLVNDILDLSKVEAGEIKVQEQACDVSDCLHDVFELLRPQAEEKLLALSVHLDSDVPREFYTDALRFRQMLINYASNAIKFTDRGSIEIRLVVENPGLQSERLSVSVVDTGRGIAPAHLGRLFQLFSQVHEPGAGEPQGTGLGLALVQRFSKLLGGGVRVTSEPGRGSRFGFWVPLRRVDGTETLSRGSLQRGGREGPIQGPSPERLDGARVLVVDDNPNNRRLFRYLLEEAGAEVRLAENGREALDQVLGRDHGEASFDLILMDMQMPELDGYEATVQLRAAGISTPVIALTAYAMSEDRDRCLAVGCNEFLPKPIEPQGFVPWLARFQRARPGSPPAAEPLPSSRHPRLGPLREEYVASLPAQARELEHCLAESDEAQLAVLLHRLKGSGQSYGFPRITELAGVAEAACRRGDGLSAAAAHVRPLLEFLHRMQASRSAPPQPVPDSGGGNEV